MNFAESILIALLVYMAIGCAFAIAFFRRGIKLTDPGARGAPVAFYLLIFPGVAALWPLVLRKWALARRLPPDATEHSTEHAA